VGKPKVTSLLGESEQRFALLAARNILPTHPLASTASFIIFLATFFTITPGRLPDLILERCYSGFCRQFRPVLAWLPDRSLVEPAGRAAKAAMVLAGVAGAPRCGPVSYSPNLLSHAGQPIAPTLLERNCRKLISFCCASSTSYSWSQSVAFAGLGDAVAKRNIRAEIDALDRLLDVSVFRARARR
jgi:hypothetical protein